MGEGDDSGIFAQEELQPVTNWFLKQFEKSKKLNPPDWFREVVLQLVHPDREKRLSIDAAKQKMDEVVAQLQLPQSAVVNCVAPKGAAPMCTSSAMAMFHGVTEPGCLACCLEAE